MKALLLLPILAASSCDPKPNKEPLRIPLSVAHEENAGRFTATKVGHFDDKSAYQNYRVIYIIRDNNTGQEFVGVSGIGITELGRHKSGKTYVEDER